MFAVTVMLVSSVDFAVIVAFPQPTAFNIPLEDTLTTFSLSEVHMILDLSASSGVTDFKIVFNFNNIYLY